MALPKFHNQSAVREIRIGVTAFACIGVLPPHDHPHVYLAIEEQSVLCPYCSTLFRFDPRLGVTDTDPPGHYFEDPGDVDGERRTDGGWREAFLAVC
jgi:uncharacterized Zn-finger protein